MTTGTKEFHAGEGALIRLLDSECDAAEAEALALHLALCADCSTRRDTLARRSASLRELLSETDLPPRAMVFGTARRGAQRPGPGPYAMRAAAALALVVAMSLTVSPVRAWIAGAAGAIWNAVTGAAPDGQRGPETPPLPSATIGFAVQGPAFTIRVASRQVAGSLVVEFTDAVASASLEEGAGTAEFVVLPAALLIRNTAATERGYRVRIPASVEQLRVVVGDGPADLMRPDPAGSQRVFGLQ
jgi:hypothetical protein